MIDICTPSPWLTRIRFTRISLTHIFHSSLNTYYETEIPSLTLISLHVILTNLVNTNFALHDFFQELKVVLTKVLVYHFRDNFGDNLEDKFVGQFQGQFQGLIGRQC